MILSRFFGKRRRDGLKLKLSMAVKRIELHRRELEMLRSRLEARRQHLFEATIRALERKDETRANVYANEHSELKRVIKVVSAGELALMQISIRLESIMDVGDIMVQVNAAFKVLKGVSKAVSGLVPALESATHNVSAALSDTLQELSAISPEITLNVVSSSAQELVEKAKRYAEEKAMEVKDGVPQSLVKAKGDGLLDRARNIALLATAGPSGEDSFSPVLLSKPRQRNVDEEVYRYMMEKKGPVDVLEASAALNIPADEVEEAVLKLASEGKIKLGR